MMVTDSLVLAGSFWRSAGPFAQYIRNFDDLQITWHPPTKVFDGDIGWPELRWNKWLFMHRPAQGPQFVLFNRAKEMGCKTWIDIDDNLFNIPPDNKSAPFYNNINTQTLMMNIVRDADVITTSTPFLKEILETLRGKNDVILLPNGLPIDLFDNTRNKLLNKKKEKQPVIMWRGSEHHQRDLYTYKDSIADCINSHPNIKWEFVGHLPWFIETQLKGKNWRAWMPTEVTQYHRNLLKAEPDVTMVPLWNSQFNMSKSNIAWIESIFSGAMTLAPNWPHWAHPGCQWYDVTKKETFEITLNRICVEMDKGWHLNKWELIDQAWDYIKEYYNVDVFNAQIRRQILKGNTEKALEFSEILQKTLYPEYKSLKDRLQITKVPTQSQS